MLEQTLRVLRFPVRAARFLADIWAFRTLGLNPVRLAVYVAELYLDRRFWGYLAGQMRSARAASPDRPPGGWLGFAAGAVLYGLVRLERPRTVVETGVGPGASSAFILNGLGRNRAGTLYSIDLPADELPEARRAYANLHLPLGFGAGWLIPPWLKGRWRLTVGDARTELPALVGRLGTLDLFLHDSLHTDEQVRFELTAVFGAVRPGGLILADDVNPRHSLAFVEFCREKALPHLVFRGRLGVARKVGGPLRAGSTDRYTYRERG